MNKESIQIIRLMSNEVVITEVVDQDDEFITLKEPFALIPTQDGKLNFIPWSPLSDPGTSVKMYIKHIVYYATPSEDVLNNYLDIFSSIITPPSAGKIIT